MGFFKTVASYGLLPLLASQLLPVAAAHHSPANAIDEQYDALHRRADPQDFYLRIMPLGASITAGDPKAPGDEGKNGYRKNLRDQLRFDGWKVNMVGSRRRGKMADNVNNPPPYEFLTLFATMVVQGKLFGLFSMVF